MVLTTEGCVCVLWCSIYSFFFPFCFILSFVSPAFAPSISFLFPYFLLFSLGSKERLVRPGWNSTKTATTASALQVTTGQLASTAELSSTEPRLLSDR